MNKKFILTIFLIAFFSISFLNDSSHFLSASNVESDDNEIDFADFHFSSNVDSDSSSDSSSNDDDFFGGFFSSNSIDIYLDGQNISVQSSLSDDANDFILINEIQNYIVVQLENSSSNITTIKEGIREICNNYGIDDCELNIDSIFGEDQIPIYVHAVGTSMLPTLPDDSYVMINKTHDIHVGDVVSADSKEYGGIMKRVAKIEGDNVYLVSDNTNITYKEINGQIYSFQGIKTWVDISEIDGVAIGVE